MKILKKRRRREGKTDYNHRKRILGGEIPRVIFRKSNRYIISQLIASKESQDRVSSHANSKELLKYGWPVKWTGSLRNIPASYLTGRLLGNKIISAGFKACILDAGLIKNIAGSRVYAFAKGIIDSGVNLKCNEKMFPSEDRIKGMHIKKDVEKMNTQEKIKKLYDYRQDQYQKLADAVYYRRGWTQNGVPTPQKMRQLGINDSKMLKMLQDKIDKDEKAGFNKWGGKYTKGEKPPSNNPKYWEKW